MYNHWYICIFSDNCDMFFSSMYISFYILLKFEIMNGLEQSDNE